MINILSIRGGGIKGLTPCTMFAALEKQIGPLWKHFDLIAGTSTGGIMAIGLALGLSAESLAQFYIGDGPKIFKRRIRSYFGIHDGKYDVNVLFNVLNERYNGQRLINCKTAALVATTDLKTYDGKFFTNWANPSMLAALAGSCTAAAPVYFDPMGTYADGGLFANDPALYAMLTYMAFHEIKDFSQVRILDVACPLAPSHPVSGIGVLGFASHAVDIFIDAGMNTVADRCAELLGGNFLQVIPSLGAASTGMDDVSSKNLSALKDAGDDFARLVVGEIIQFLKG